MLVDRAISGISLRKGDIISIQRIEGIPAKKLSGEMMIVVSKKIEDIGAALGLCYLIELDNGKLASIMLAKHSFAQGNDLIFKPNEISAFYTVQSYTRRLL